MTNSQPKNQLSFVREILEFMYKFYEDNGNFISVSFILEQYCENSSISLEPETLIYSCIHILQEHITYYQINNMSEDGSVENLIQIKEIFKDIFRVGLQGQFSYNGDENVMNIFPTPMRDIKFHISILKKIESRYPKYEITDAEIEQYRTTINEMIEAIKNANLPPDVKSKIFKNLLEIKQMLDNIYAFSREDIEKEIIYNCTLWNQLDENNEFIQENKPKFLQWTKDFMNNIVSKIKDPNFMSETILRGILGAEIGAGMKHLPEIVEKILPPH
jgi:hypothetical protein